VVVVTLGGGATTTRGGAVVVGGTFAATATLGADMVSVVEEATSTLLAATIDAGATELGAVEAGLAPSSSVITVGVEIDSAKISPLGPSALIVTTRIEGR
jgi:hypothetical protein